MATAALFIRLEAKPGREAEVESLLKGGLPVVQEEPATPQGGVFGHENLGQVIEVGSAVDRV